MAETGRPAKRVKASDDEGVIIPRPGPGPESDRAVVSREMWFHGIHGPAVPSIVANYPEPAREDRLLQLDIYGTLTEKHTRLPATAIHAMYRDVRERTGRAIGGLTEAELLGVCEPSLNPIVWAVGHCGHFYEAMVLRLLRPGLKLHEADSGTLLAGWDVDAAFDSFRADHDDRWTEKALAEVVPLTSVGTAAPKYPSCAELLAGYRDRLTNMLEDDLRRQHPPGTSDLVPPVETYLHTYGIIHEHWHIEDWIQTRQTMAYSPPAPRPAGPGPTVAIANAWGGTFKLEPFVTDYDPTNEGGGPCPGEVEVPGGRYMLGGSKKQPWLFDAERFEHPVVIKPFAIDKAPVTNAAYAEFIEAGGYHDKQFWSHEGWRWLTRKSPILNVGQHEVDGAGRRRRVAPRYWHRVRAGTSEDGSSVPGWRTARFDEPNAPLRPNQPAVHISWYEAEAYARWKGRRLPTEAEWEVAALAEPDVTDKSKFREGHKRIYPWGSEPPNPAKCNIDGYRGGLLDVGALPEGDSAFGCRQMMGQVWEWTATAFWPYPGFLPDFPYRENTCPWFGYRKVVKGACWATSAPIARGGYRHSFWPNMDAVFTGFRTVRDL